MDTKTFNKRTQNALNNLKHRAKKLKLPVNFDLDQLRNHVKLKIGCHCRYCKEPITEANFSLDHRTPLTRGGDFGLQNQDVIDVRCNKIKNALTAMEFWELLQLLDKWHPLAKKNVLSRLYNGSRMFFRPKKAA